MADDPFTVTIHSGFTEDGIWTIDARLEWLHGPPANGTELRGRGLMALLHAIATEGQRGRSLGARKVDIRMQGHEEIASSASGGSQERRLRIPAEDE
jgi:hypothetical protein